MLDVRTTHALFAVAELLISSTVYTNNVIVCAPTMLSLLYVSADLSRYPVSVLAHTHKRLLDTTAKLAY